uniref:RNA-directed DNA polymerase, eukaryota n=1 Tax=Tanacetum cinerariifolium TaxID=118510 RepID=A0A6L2LXB5_TANCI|nr:RNA-directed DNA polymerase, eukaryota [Tanacetum cinerariifolium]
MRNFSISLVLVLVSLSLFKQLALLKMMKGSFRFPLRVFLSKLGVLTLFVRLHLYGVKLEAWFPNFQEDDQDDLFSDGESQEGDVTNKADNYKSDVNRVSELSFMHENDTAHKDVNSCKKGEVGSHSKDPFNIYGILDGQKNNVCNSCSDDPKFPPGFTLDNNDQEKNLEENIKDSTECVQSLSNKLNDRCLNRRFSSQRSMNSHSQKSKVVGSILDLMDELVTVGQTMGYNMAAKAESISLHTIKDLWGNQMFDHVVGSSVGCSGGILCMWNPNMFVKEQVSTCDYFVALMCTWAPTSSKLLIISAYAPQELNERRDLWDYLRTFIDRWEGDTVIMGDFNEVHSEHERFGSTFNRQGAIAFNNFISLACLIDLPLEETNYDYGPSLFRFFYSWFAMEGFNSFVETNWKSLNIVEPNGLIRLKKKLQALKIAIKAWSKEAKKRSNNRNINIQQNLLEVDKLIDQGKSNDEILIKRITLLNDLQELNNRNAVEISQKAKIRWSIEDQVQYLERSVTYEEVKRAVWDCGTSKSPGPDGFSFEFYPSRLKINLLKNKLMEIGVSSNVVAATAAASLIVCSILTAPFNYLGVKLGDVALKVLYKRLYALEMCKSISVAEKMGHPSLSHSFRTIPRGGIEQENYGLLCSKAADLMLPNILDRWCWSLEGSQEFSVKSSCILIDNTILPKAKVPTRLLKVVPIKVNVHA